MVTARRKKAYPGEFSASKVLDTPPSAAPSVYVVSVPNGTFRSPRGAGAIAFRRVGALSRVREVFRSAPKASVWVSSSTDFLGTLSEERAPKSRDQRLLLLDATTPVAQQFSRAYFSNVLAPTDGLSVIEPAALAEVLASPHRSDLFIAGAYVPETSAILLYRGNLDVLVIPVTWFTNAASTASITPDAIEVVDSGQTIRLGEFEASANAILYKFDAEYRRAAKKKAVAEDRSLGASIRRLRLQKGLTREDFPGVTPKTIARIERGEVERPRDATLEIIARALGCTIKQIGGF